MTLPEYAYRMKAYSLAQVDKEYDMHLQAWLNDTVGATKAKGKESVRIYKSFKDFFDYQKRIGEIEKPRNEKLNTQHKRMAQIAARLNQ